VKSVPHVASKASVLKSQNPGLSQRTRMPEAKDNTSPFSILLAETGGSNAPAQQPSTRIVGTSTTQRNDASRNAARHSEASRADETGNESAADAPDACAAESAAADQPEDAATGAELAAVAQLIAKPALPEQPAETTAEPAVDDDTSAAIDAALAAAVDVPVTPAQTVNATETPTLAAAVMPPPAAAAPAETGTPEGEATAPIGTAAPAKPDVAAGIATPDAAPAPDSGQASDGPDQPAQQTAANVQAPVPPELKQAKPATEAATTQATDQSRPTTSADTTTSSESTATATATTPEQAEVKSEPHKPTHAETHAQASARANTSDTPDRPPSTGSTVSDFVQATQPTPDSSHLAHLQGGREFGHSVAATAQASHAADGSNLPVSAPVPLESLAVEIATRAQGGSNRFEIRLDPPELGRIDVRLDIDRSGNVTSRLVVEKAETLDVLRRDAHQLERALQDAGLKTSDNSLQFSLRDQSFTGRNDQGGNGQQLRIVDPELPATENAPLVYGQMLRGGGGIDIRV
jgi:flagellar hook-length control protein FliK